jgi:lipoprotein
MNKYLLTPLILTVAALICSIAVSCSPHDSDSDMVVEQLSEERIDNMLKHIAMNSDDLNMDSMRNTAIFVMHDKSSDQYHDSFWENSSPESLLALSIGMVAVIMPFLFGVAVVMLILRYLRRKRLDKYHIIELALERGMPLPDSFYLSDTRSNNNTPRSAIVWMGWGICLAGFFILIDGEAMAMLALIPFFIGVARGVTYLINRHDSRSEKTDNNTPFNGEEC